VWVMLRHFNMCLTIVILCCVEQYCDMQQLTCLAVILTVNCTLTLFAVKCVLYYGFEIRLIHAI
jgi:hypothetical protein